MRPESIAFLCLEAMVFLGMVAIYLLAPDVKAPVEHDDTHHFV